MPDSVPPPGTFAIPELVKETTTTTGAVGVGSRYNLQGAIAGRLAVGSQLGDGIKATFCVKDSESPPDYEVFEGHYVDSTDEVEVDRLLQTSNGNDPVVWPGSGSREIFLTFAARTVEQITDPDATAGFLVATSATGGHTYERRTIDEGTADFLDIVDGDGVSGNPTFNQAWRPLRAAQGTEAQRRMSDYLTLGATNTKIDSGGLAFGTPHTFWGSGGVGADDWLKVIKNATGDFTLQSMQDNGAGGKDHYDILTQNQVSEWLPTILFATSTSDVQATIEGETEVSYTTPATGTYKAIALATIQANTNAGVNGGLAAYVQTSHGANPWATQSTGENDVYSASASQDHTAVAILGETLTASTTHRWRASEAHSGAGLSATATRPHGVYVIIARTA